MKKYKLAELFCGPGGFAEGAKQAKLFTHVWVNDIDQSALDTFSHNHPECETIHGDGSKIFNKQKMSELKKRHGSIDGLIFGFPCNDFSMVGKKLGLQGDYGGLYKVACKVLKYFQPEFFVAENVTAISSKDQESETYKNFTSKPELHNTFFIPPYHNDTIMMNLSEKIKELGYNSYSGKYNGPMDLLNYKAVIHIPYAWSNLAFFEMFSLGIVYFIPTIKFLNLLKKEKDFFWSPPYIESLLNLSEWYNSEHKDLLIYFDSWEDLVLKIESLKYGEHKLKLKKYGKILEINTLNKWKLLIDNK